MLGTLPEFNHSLHEEPLRAGGSHSQKRTELELNLPAPKPVRTPRGATRAETVC